MSSTPNFVNQEYWFLLMNPSMRTTSKIFGWFRHNIPLYHTKHLPLLGYFKFMFGYDDSKETYKVVAFRVKGDPVNEASVKSEVKVYSLGDNCWRNIHGFHVIPFKWLSINSTDCFHNHGVQLSGTINWLAIYKYFRCRYLHKNITHVDQFVILMLDLSTETFKQLLLPQGFDEVPFDEPLLSVLMGCLCFSYDFRKTEFVLWQMKEYGVHESWKQLFKISYQNINYLADSFQLACLYMNDDKVIFAKGFRSPEAMIYNLRYNIVEKINITNYIQGFSHTNVHYIESLVAV